MKKKCSETYSKILERSPLKISLTELHFNEPSIAYTPNFTKNKFFHMCLLKFRRISHEIPQNTAFFGTILTAALENHRKTSSSVFTEQKNNSKYLLG